MTKKKEEQDSGLIELAPAGRIGLVKHPNLPKVWMEVQELDSADELRLTALQRSKVVPLGVIDPTTGEVLRDDRNEPYYHLAQSEDFMTVMGEFLIKQIRTAAGVGMNGRPLEQVGIEELHRMMRTKALDVTEPVIDRATKKPRMRDGKPVTTTMSWPAFVAVKLRDPATFGESDPEGKA